MTKIVHETKSICPECLKVINAELFEENGQIKIRKTSLPGGFGVVEPAMTAVFLLRGLSLSSAITIVLIDRLLTLWVTSLLGFGCVHFPGVEPKIKYQVDQ